MRSELPERIALRSGGDPRRAECRADVVAAASNDSDAPAGFRPNDFEAATAELERLEAAIQIGRDLRASHRGQGVGSPRVDAPLGDRRRAGGHPTPARVSPHMKRVSTQVSCDWEELATWRWRR